MLIIQVVHGLTVMNSSANIGEVNKNPIFMLDVRDLSDDVECHQGHPRILQRWDSFSKNEPA